jgi:hypothetical protein
MTLNEQIDLARQTLRFVEGKREQSPESRIVLIKIFVTTANKVGFQMVSPALNTMMHTWDLATQKETEEIQAAAQNNNKVELKKWIHAADYVKEPDYPHPGIHLSMRNDDQIMWFSEDPINFTVSVHRDPQIVSVTEEDMKPENLKDNRPKIVPNVPRENPFVRTFPLFSLNGSQVLSGGLRKEADVKNQRYYKYNIVVDGIAEPLDPHIEGHDD